jgi:hypothetical protein
VQDKTSDSLNTLPNVVVTRNYFVPLRTADMDTDTSDTKALPREEAVAGKTGRPLPIMITSSTNPIQFEKQQKGVVKGNFEFRSTRKGTTIILKTMEDFSTIKSYLENNNLAYFTFYPKFLKPINTATHHLPLNTPAEDMSDGLVSPGK